MSKNLSLPAPYVPLGDLKRVEIRVEGEWIAMALMSQESIMRLGDHMEELSDKYLGVKRDE